MAIVTTVQTTQVTLADGDDLFVSRNGGIYTFTYAISASLNNIIEIAGEVVSEVNGALYATGGANQITVHSTGIVSDISGIGIFMDSPTAGGNTLVNYGAVSGGHAAFWDYSGGDTIINHGIISSTGTALVLGGGAGAGHTVRNAGTIVGGNYAIGSSGGDDLVVNTGTLNGAVSLSSGNDTLDSGSGDVFGIVNGQGGDDRLLLGRTDDTLDGGEGADELVGGGGYDYASYASAFGAGVTAYLVAPRLNTGDAFGDAYDGIEGLIGSRYADVLGGDNSANVIRGGEGADTMRGYGSDDRFFVDVATDVVIEAANGGFDRVFAGATYTLAAAAEVEVVSTLGTATTTVVSLTGNGFDNVMMGNAAGNQLSGLAGADNINGYAGNDRIYGGLGLDTMTGGAGLDNFYFDTALNATSNVDRILDFSHADDTIRLSQTVFTTLLTGVLSADAYRAGAAAADATDRIIYNKATGALFYDRDGAGGAAQIQFAWLPKDLVLSGGDFIVY
jgi:Ca2+-binding RTX toxin-like protein